MKHFPRLLLIRSALVLVGIILAGGILEIGLKVHNPFESRVVGDKIVLPADRTYQFKNDLSPSLDPEIIHTKNSLGFRGDEPPDEFDAALTVVTIGGSTTESIYISDGKTWSDALAIQMERSFDDSWLNNAGLDGHSTYGHLILMKDHVSALQPDVALFLIGVNDRSRIDPANPELDQLKSGISLGSPKSFVKSLSPYSEVISLGFNAYRSWQAKSQGLNHARIDLRQEKVVPLEQAGWEEIESLHRDTYLPGFKRRIIELIDVSRNNGIEPVFVTQPTLFGNGYDPSTGVDLKTVPISGVSGQRAWNVLELYNQITRDVGEQEQVLGIDLASKLEKDSRYYYDYIHYNNEGSAKAGALIWTEFCPFLALKFPTHLEQQCGP